MPFHLFVFFKFFFSLTIFCSVQCTSLSLPWLSLFLSILFFVDTVVNGIVFLTSFFGVVHNWYRNESYFCVLILYLATLLNFLISSNSFGGGNLQGFLHIRLCHLQIERILHLHFLFACVLSLSRQISLVRTSSSVLNTSGKSGHPCLVSDLGGKVFSFSLLASAVSCEFFIYGLYYVEVISFYLQFVEIFYHERC